MTDPVTDSKDEISARHEEDSSSNILTILSSPIPYDDDKITQSPYVFGASLLASFGGFSFGYGKLQKGDLLYFLPFQIKGSYLSFWLCRNSVTSTPKHLQTLPRMASM